MQVLASTHSRARVVFFVRNLLHPTRRASAFAGLLQSEMHEDVPRRRAVPVLDVGLEDNRVARLHGARLFAFYLNSPDSRQNMKHLSQRMRVPRRARSGRKCHTYSVQARGLRGNRNGIEPDTAREPLGRRGFARTSVSFDDFYGSFLVSRAEQAQIRKIVRRLGPWAPRTRIRSMSPVRLGPVTKETRLGHASP